MVSAPDTELLELNMNPLIMSIFTAVSSGTDKCLVARVIGANESNHQDETFTGVAEMRATSRVTFLYAQSY